MPRAKKTEEAPKKAKVYVVVSAVEMLVDETSDRALMAVVEERAKQLGLPIEEVRESGLIRVFRGEEVVLKVERPRVEFGNEPS